MCLTQNRCANIMGFNQVWSIWQILSYRAEMTEQKPLTFRDPAKRNGQLLCVCTPDFFASLNTFRYFCQKSESAEWSTPN
jgi:hypothetical protein